MTSIRMIGMCLAALLIGSGVQAAQSSQRSSTGKSGFDSVPDVRLTADEPGGTKESKTTTVTETESAEHNEKDFDTYTSLEDGQPGEPGEIELNYSNGWQTTSGESDPWLMTAEIEYTFKCPPLHHTQLSLAVPLELLNGGVDGNGDMEFSWTQLWLEEQACNWWPSFSTINTLRIPSGYHSEKVDWTLTFVLAKDLGPGTVYMNSYIKSANGSNNLEEGNGSWWDSVCGEDKGDDLRNFQWGFRFGYKWRITDCFAIIPAYILESSELRGNHDRHRGEISAEWKVSDRLTIGPGILFGLDGGDESPNFGAGVMVHYGFAP